DLVASDGEALAYLRDETVFDAPTGIALLQHISELTPRYDAQGRVVGWYALNRARTAVWSDGDGEPTPFATFEGRVVEMRATRHGLVVYLRADHRLVLRWFHSNGTSAWERALPGHMGRF